MREKNLMKEMSYFQIELFPFVEECPKLTMLGLGVKTAHKRLHN